MIHRYAPLLKRLLEVTHRIEDGLLVAVLGTMIVFAVSQILLRNVFGGGIVWADPLLRVLVLWVGLVGAMVASRTDNHIAINVLSRFLPSMARATTGALVALFTATVCAVIAYHATRFVVAEYNSGIKAVGQVPAWLAESVIPFAFSVIALRYFVLTAVRLRQISTASDRP